MSRPYYAVDVPTASPVVSAETYRGMERLPLLDGEAGPWEAHERGARCAGWLEADVPLAPGEELLVTRPDGLAFRAVVSRCELSFRRPPRYEFESLGLPWRAGGADAHAGGR